MSTYLRTPAVASAQIEVYGRHRRVDHFDFAPLERGSRYESEGEIRSKNPCYGDFFLRPATDPADVTGLG